MYFVLDRLHIKLPSCCFSPMASLKVHSSEHHAAVTSTRDGDPMQANGREELKRLGAQPTDHCSYVRSSC